MLILISLYFVLGTAKADIPLYTVDDLININNCLNCSYTLYADITISNLWTSLGDSRSPFRGVLSGNGYAINFTGFNISSKTNVGLFDTMIGATISQLTLRSHYPLNITDASTEFSFGLLAGIASASTIEGCIAILSGSIRHMHGTIVLGALMGTIIDSFVSTSVINIYLSVYSLGILISGGVAGESVYAHISKCKVHITIDLFFMKQLTFGGLVGYSRVSIGFASFHATALEQTLSTLRKKNNTETNLIDCNAVLIIDLYETSSINLGGVAGIVHDTLNVSNCSVAVQLDGFISKKFSKSFIGGAIGYLEHQTANILRVFVNATILLDIQAPDLEIIYVGGLLGYIQVMHFSLKQCIAIVNIIGNWNRHYVGGLIGQIISQEAIILNSGTLGTVATMVHNYSTAIVGGIVGFARGLTLRQCYFIGAISTDENSLGESLSIYHVGAMLGHIHSSGISLSFTLANISVSGYKIVAGSIGLSINSTIEGCYAVVSLITSTLVNVTMGGMVGQMTNGTTIVDSFVIGTLNAIGKANVACIGGFVGLLRDAPDRLSIKGCYVWSTISISLCCLPYVVLGGFVGMIENAAEIDSCIVYANVSSLMSVMAGLLIGGITNKNANEASLDSVVIRFAVAYVAPYGNIHKVGLIGSELGGILLDSYCGKYLNTKNCIPLKTLNMKKFLKHFDFTNTFQFNSSLSDGKLAFQILPMPLSGSVPRFPKIALPTSPQAVYWLLSTWITKPGILQDFPYLIRIEYDTYCGEYIGCHGVGTSPFDAVCRNGWSSPPQNTTALVGNLHRCNVFTCSSYSNCKNKGTCSQGKCICVQGYEGPDCSEKEFQ